MVAHPDFYSASLFSSSSLAGMGLQGHCSGIPLNDDEDQRTNQYASCL
jgi:hypothetical protein